MRTWRMKRTAKREEKAAVLLQISALYWRFSLVVEALRKRRRKRRSIDTQCGVILYKNGKGRSKVGKVGKQDEKGEEKEERH
mmetsp:Transcript_15439/g.39061  ORF Transcript_15439/g.39061 Transcript_15439/m.39061 type:complete len:82 (-) Transcript_15439:1888-2133(-)